jgi:hypothetical protein
MMQTLFGLFLMLVVAPVGVVLVAMWIAGVERAKRTHAENLRKRIP